MQKKTHDQELAAIRSLEKSYFVKFYYILFTFVEDEKHLCFRPLDGIQNR